MSIYPGPRMTSPAVLRRVVHLVARLPVGGMENVVVNLLRQMPAARYDSEVWCLETSDVQGVELRSHSEPVFEFDKRRRRDPWLFVRLAQRLRQQRVDIVHCHDELSWFYGAIAARLSGRARVIVTMHGRRAGMSRRHVIEQRILARTTEKIVTVSDYLHAQLVDELAPKPARLVTIKNGIRLSENEGPDAPARARAKLGVAADVPLIGTVGELSTVKNIPLAIEAVGLARRAVPHLRLALVGDGALREALGRLATAHGLEDAVHFVGLRRDVPELLHGFDVYLCSSDYEGISLSILEAMAASRPVLATAVGGNSELVAEGVTGRLVPPRDADAMAAALIEMFRSPDRTRRLGARAQAFVHEAYSLERMIHDYDRLYSSVAHAHAEQSTSVVMPHGRI